MHNPGKSWRPDEWNAWYGSHSEALVLFARQWLSTHTDAEDAVQEGFVRFWQRRHNAQDPVAYLYACVKSAAHDRLRSEARRRVRARVCLREPPTLRCVVDTLDTAEAIETALSRLPAEQREVVVMKVWGGLTFTRIAGALGINANTAASRYRLAIRALRPCLREESMR